jgi:hypothetical protein
MLPLLSGIMGSAQVGNFVAFIPCWFCVQAAMNFTEPQAEAQ